MTDGFADLVMPLFRRVIELQRRLARGEARTLDEVMRQVQSWLDETGRRAVTDPTLARSFDRARFGLVAWIDEVLTDSEWGRSVGWGSEEHVLEWLTFGSRDRAWRFFEHADELEAQGDLDPLEAYLQCVTLGFRGELSYDPDRMTDWVERVYGRIGEAGAVEARPFAEEEGGVGLRPLGGPSLLVRVSALAGVTMLLTLAAYLFSVHHEYYSAG
ncbi:DotU family type IV/VI secretion system protein [Paludisphaera soli]|uniref:DotU family type IV/VI secretion system protein n=1 Tax=Paludisphaera soli TaxID=2712865 RepID=UPI0013EB0A08|nr:DotU family type IV/VI secretion system protein [Paludisphaera soli]